MIPLINAHTNTLQPGFKCRHLKGVSADILSKLVSAWGKCQNQDIRSVDLADCSVDGDQVLQAHYIPVLASMEMMFGDTANKNKMNYGALPSFAADGDRIFQGLETGVQLGVVRVG